MDGEDGAPAPALLREEYIRQRRALFALTRARLEDVDSRWSYLEALAWIMYRDASAAAAFVALYQHDNISSYNVAATAALVTVALPSEDQGSGTARFAGYLGEGFGPDLSTVIIDCTFPVRLLQYTLQEGSVVAYGKPNGERVQVLDRGEWPSMEATRHGWRSRNVEWDDVSFCASSIRKELPSITSGTPASFVAVKGQKCAEWLRQPHILEWIREHAQLISEKAMWPELSALSGGEWSPDTIRDAAKGTGIVAKKWVGK